jgi:hypothetical protein
MTCPVRTHQLAIKPITKFIATPRKTNIASKPETFTTFSHGEFARAKTGAATINAARNSNARRAACFRETSALHAFSCHTSYGNHSAVWAVWKSDSGSGKQTLWALPIHLFSRPRKKRVGLERNSAQLISEAIRGLFFSVPL